MSRRERIIKTGKGLLLFTAMCIFLSSISQAYANEKWHEFTIEDIMLFPGTELERGDTLLCITTIKNNVQFNGTVVVLLEILYPNKTWTYPESQTVEIEAGETETVTLKWSDKEARFGTYRVSIDVTTPDGSHTFDTLEKGVSFRLISPTLLRLLELIVNVSVILASIVAPIEIISVHKQVTTRKRKYAMLLTVVIPIGFFVAALIAALLAIEGYPASLNSILYEIAIYGLPIGMIAFVVSLIALFLAFLPLE